MVEKTICKPNDCTACKACINVCRLKCIEMIKDVHGVLKYKIDADKCIDCGMCKSVCPILHNQKNEPKKAYVAWSEDGEIHAKSASGGIATEIYKFLLKKNYSLVGTKWSNDFTVKLCIGNRHNDIIEFQNSKYTYSDPTFIYQDVLDEIKNGKKVLFIGLPCQTAAMGNILQKKNVRDKCVLIDLVCHGIPPEEYLQQHIKLIEKKKGKKAKTVTFRDPRSGTENYCFSLFDYEDARFYAKRVKRNDVYHLGYHCALIYRENCYHCKFATNQRCGDLTLADYSGLGTGGSVEFIHGRQLSCVLCNTERGEILISQLVSEGIIEAHERPLSEELEHERQLNAPSIPHAKRDVFLKQYEQTMDFDCSAYGALKKEIFKNELTHYLLIKELTSFLRIVAKKILPVRVQTLLKDIVKMGGSVMK